MFYVAPSGQFTLSHITLFGGNEPMDGGAIFNDGILALENTFFIHNMQGSTPKAWTNRSQVNIKQGNNDLSSD